MHLRDRNRFAHQDVHCMLCGGEEENLRHFLLECTSLSGERSRSLELQRPYIEVEEDVIGNFLFTAENIEAKKEVLGLMFRRREELMKNTEGDARLTQN